MTTSTYCFVTFGYLDSSNFNILHSLAHLKQYHKLIPAQGNKNYLLSLYHYYCKYCYYYPCTLLSLAKADKEVMKLRTKIFHFQFCTVSSK